VDDYMCKPFSKEELVARVKAVLRRTAVPDRPAAPAAVPPAGLTGHTDHIPMPDLFQLLSLNGKSGTLHLWGASVARVYLRGGQIINAETQGLKGEKALFRIMAWPSARFEFVPGEPERDIDIELTGSTSSVLMDGFTHLDELRDLIAALPPGDRRLRVPAAKAASLDQIELSTMQRIILYTAGGRGATTSEIIDTVPQRDLEAYRTLTDLVRRGLLEVVVADGSQAPESPL